MGTRDGHDEGDGDGDDDNDATTTAKSATMTAADITQARSRRDRCPHPDVSHFRYKRAVNETFSDLRFCKLYTNVTRCWLRKLLPRITKYCCCTKIILKNCLKTVSNIKLWQNCIVNIFNLPTSFMYWLYDMYSWWNRVVVLIRHTTPVKTLRAALIRKIRIFGFSSNHVLKIFTQYVVVVQTRYLGHGDRVLRPGLFVPRLKVFGLFPRKSLERMK